MRCWELAAEVDRINTIKGLSEHANLVPDLLNNDCIEMMLPQKECVCRVVNVAKDPNFMHMAEVEREESGGLGFAPALLFQSVPVHCS